MQRRVYMLIYTSISASVTVQIGSQPQCGKVQSTRLDAVQVFWYTSIRSFVKNSSKKPSTSDGIWSSVSILPGSTTVNGSLFKLQANPVICYVQDPSLVSRLRRKIVMTTSYCTKNGLFTKYAVQTSHTL